jgi:hypothetical protein
MHPGPLGLGASDRRGRAYMRIRIQVAELTSSDPARRGAVGRLLGLVRYALLSDLGMAFAQVTHPQWAAATPEVDAVGTLCRTWHQLYETYRTQPRPTLSPASKRPRRGGARRGGGGRAPLVGARELATVPPAWPAAARPWPWPRRPYVAAAKEQALLVPVAGARLPGLAAPPRPYRAALMHALSCCGNRH